MTIPDNLTAHYGVGLSYDPVSYKYGYEDPTVALLERIRNRAILNGRNRITQLQINYLQSYLSTSPPTVAQFKDLLISMALGLAGRCCQTRDVSFTLLTGHAMRYWTMNNATSLLWRRVPPFSKEVPYVIKDGFYGLAGSLAFMMFKYNDSGQGLYPLQLVQRMLDWFWYDLADATLARVQAPVIEDKENLIHDLLALEQVKKQDSHLINLTPRQQHAFAIQQIGIGMFPFKGYEALLDAAWASPQDVNLVEIASPILRIIRSNSLTPGDWSEFRKRFILGEYSASLVNAITDIQTFLKSVEGNPLRARFKLEEASAMTFQQLANLALLFNKPAGMPLVYLALTVQALMRAANLLVGLRREVQMQPLSNFLFEEAQQDVRLKLAKEFSTAYDAMAALGFNNVLLDGAGMSYRYFLTSVDLIQGMAGTLISKDGNERLYEFEIDN